MESNVTLGGHPIHPMLVGFPITFYATSLASYSYYEATKDPFWYKVGYGANVAGVVTALAAAVPGFIDWATAIPSEHPAKKTGLVHMALNVAALACFGINALTHKKDEPQSGSNPVLLPAIGFGITLAAGFYGWTLVQKHHVGVDEGDGQLNIKSGEIDFSERVISEEEISNY